MIITIIWYLYITNLQQYINVFRIVWVPKYRTYFIEL